MVYILLVMALGTLPVSVMVWRDLVRERRAWEQEQSRRQDRLMREDVERWTDRVAWALATTGESYELGRVRPLPKPTLRHRGPYTAPWFLIAAMWFASVAVAWMLITLIVAILLYPPWRELPGAQDTSVAEWHAMCAKTWAALPDEIPQCCQRFSGVPCPRSAR
jgi:Flp pilus assembly protein TadB